MDISIYLISFSQQIQTLHKETTDIVGLVWVMIGSGYTPDVSMVMHLNLPYIHVK